jgi:hypothetical protein
MAHDDRRRHAKTLALGCVLALLVAVGCSSQQSLPDFPPFPPADDFLAMQARMQAYRPPTPEAYVYSERNAEIYRDLQAHARLSAALAAQREEMRAQFMRQERTAHLAEWDALNRRLARDEALNALAGQQRSANAASNEELYRARYQRYQDRLESLAREREAVAEQQAANAYEHQQRIQAQLDEMRRRQSENLKLQVLSAPPPGAAPAPGSATSVVLGAGAPAPTTATPAPAAAGTP